MPLFGRGVFVYLWNTENATGLQQNFIRARIELLIHIWVSGISLQKLFMLHLYNNVAYCTA